ncbi:cell division protein FtsI (penicillin-binding protein 3) [Microbacteriaceae bacterium SG_E_30_P1]|uniref:Cell division protein FtsI (Penicillin-binding protein 3) n=1 Tax=Antiquaquibacter oligotrophicus TaxID=2880260 RepID=A0ABT6KLT8_9MICO|nr:penicillin-binding protein 2 [Antiquaquibacter oligotrophicus]MDH6180814.1 cell division protein FtsI (penicillin-binding protein 3) [Antiquaquibacter oligotrophicus]UDF13469.1 penicillin-binding protein 2 [Antiquaquibacter oligotrophicus]
MRTRRSRLRISIAVLAIFAVVSVFVVRLVDIQLVQAQELNAAALEKRAQELVTYGVRGNIVDTNGAVLAGSVERYDITASPRSALGRTNGAAAVTAELESIAAVTGQNPTDLLAVLTEDPESDFVYLKKGVPLEEFQKVRDLDVPWVYFELRPSRTYPNGELAGNLVGFLGTDGPQAGVELSENDCLKSTNGTAVYEKGEDGTRLPGSLVTTQEPKDGGTLKLTIDRDLQFYVQQRMAQAYNEFGAEWVTAVVQRVDDGHLMAVVDYPTVDPNDPSLARRDALGSRAFSWAYEPGSTMKTLTAASLIDAGVADPYTQVMAPGRIYLSDGGYIKDAWAHEDTPYTLTGALVDSSNTAFSILSAGLDAETRRNYMLAFGLNQATEVGFLSESEGLVHETQDWDERTNYTVQFGQGLTLTTVQLASAYQAIANDGVRTPVVLVEGCEQPDGTVTDLPQGEERRVISEDAARQTLDMMESIVSVGGNHDMLAIPGYRIAAKSGTAEVAENGVYGDKTVISFAGMAPAEDPQYVVAVSAGIPTSMYNSTAIATTFHDVMAQTLTTFRVPPSGQQSPSLPLHW